MTEKIRYGIDNPHPLFNRKTELVWEGKYDEYGRRREVDIAGCAMPLQKIEAIDEPLSRATAQGELDLFKKERTRIQFFSGGGHRKYTACVKVVDVFGCDTSITVEVRV